MRRTHTPARAGRRHGPVVLGCVLAALALGGLAVPGLAAARQERGVVLHSLWPENTDRDITRDLDLARAIGSRVVKVDVGWAALEPWAKGRFAAWYERRLDRFVGGAHSRGMKVIFSFWGSPCWASTAPRSVKRGCRAIWDSDVVAYPPARAADYAATARWLTRRYRRDLLALEVWNEPDLPSSQFWRTGDKAGAYTTLVRAAYPAAKAGNRRVAVLAGALAGADEPFLAALYARGIRGSYDGLSVHAYGGQVGRLPALHRAQRRAGDRRQLWVTEFGAPTGSFLSPAGQAQDVGRDFRKLRRLGFVRAATLYKLRDTSWNPADLAGSFGILRPDFSAKPAFTAAAAALRAR